MLLFLDPGDDVALLSLDYNLENKAMIIGVTTYPREVLQCYVLSTLCALLFCFTSLIGLFYLFVCCACLLCPVFGEKWTYSNGHLFFLFPFFSFPSNLFKLRYLENRLADLHEI